MLVKRVKLSAIKTKGSLNANKMNADKLLALQRSIEELGYIDPITVWEGENNTYIVAGGAHRLAALKALGYKEIDVVILGKLPKEKEKIFEHINNENLVRNKVTINDVLKIAERENIDLSKVKLYGYEHIKADGLLKKLSEDAKKKAEIRKLAHKLALEIASRFVEEKTDFVVVLGVYKGKEHVCYVKRTNIDKMVLNKLKKKFNEILNEAENT